MSKLIKRTLAAAIAIAAVAAPTVAFARPNLDPISAVAPAVSAATQAPPAPPSQATPPAARPATVASSGFQWRDAAVGAAGALVLISIGSGTAVAVRRRNRLLAS
jgi:hypothetical protein